jgi:hypothetical protein
MAKNASVVTNVLLGPTNTTLMLNDIVVGFKKAMMMILQRCHHCSSTMLQKKKALRKKPLGFLVKSQDNPPAFHLSCGCCQN